jgi:hypothetical protein
MILRYVVVPVAPIISGITFVFTFHMRGIFVLGSSQLSSLSHFSLLKLWHLLAYMFLLHYHWLCQVYCWGWLCQFTIVDTPI